MTIEEKRLINKNQLNIIKDYVDDNFIGKSDIGEGLEFDDTGKLVVNGSISITIDNTLSTTSENSVQNKVITEALNKKANASELGDLAKKSTVSKSDLDTEAQASLSKADSALQEETDPTVPAWAKEATKPSYTPDEVGAAAAGHIHDDRYYTESEVDTKLSTKLDTSLKGSSNGLAELDESGKVPSSQLPSFVDDVLEFDTLESFPNPGESGKIYVTKDTNKSYRWSGSGYTEISKSLALGETASTAYPGDKGKIAYDHSQSEHAPIDAEKNIIIGIQKNGADLAIGEDRKVNITVPTKASDINAADSNHTHDDRYYTEEEVNTLLENKVTTDTTQNISGTKTFTPVQNFTAGINLGGKCTLQYNELDECIDFVFA